MARFHRCDRCGREFTGGVTGGQTSAFSTPGKQHTVYVTTTPFMLTGLSPSSGDYCAPCVAEIIILATPATPGKGDDTQ